MKLGEAVSCDHSCDHSCDSGVSENGLCDRLCHNPIGEMVVN